MQSSRFDRFSQVLGAKLSRRHAMVGGAGAAAVTLTQSGASLAQATPPSATPEPEASVSFLYVQTFGGGTISDVDENGDAMLALSTAPSNTIAFADHPARNVMALPTDELPEQLSFTEGNPPNAALVTQDEEGNTVVLVVELFDPVYDPSEHLATYRIRELKEFSMFDESLTYYAVPLGEMPALFGAASLFIDDGDYCNEMLGGCADDSQCCSGLVCASGIFAVDPSDPAYARTHTVRMMMCLTAP